LTTDDLLDPYCKRDQYKLIVTDKQSFGEVLKTLKVEGYRLPRNVDCNKCVARGLLGNWKLVLQCKEIVICDTWLP
jgi:hypothetical protein